MVENVIDAGTTERTRQKLLVAATEVFAKQGFKSSTIRQIVTKARVNVAAVNYHFRDKATLYSEVLKFALGSILKKYPPDMGVTPGSTPEQKLEAFILSFFLRVLDQSSGAWHGPLMAREMADPTSALDDLVDHVLRPLGDYLNSILREFLGSTATAPLLNACAASVVGQILFYRHCQPVIAKLNPTLTYRREDLERLARHVYEFSLAGIRALAAGARR
ncbi:MAG: TetR family transcriptional [Planctomycetota bacterium]|nr:MAG: TetR family transcriptional [Planctomycetota bacterium]